MSDGKTQTGYSRRRFLKSGGALLAGGMIGFLKAGSSRYAIEILKGAGVDLTTSAPFESTMKVMNEVMDEIEAIEKTMPPTKGKPKGAKSK